MGEKRIRTSADLAINGAPPAFETPVHVGRPNIGGREGFMQRVSQILDNQWLTNNGPMVQEFEQRIAEHLGVKHCVAMCNGTIALEIAIRALGLSGEVIVPSWTFVATAHALYWQGITPVFADIDRNTHNLDPDAVRKMITPRTTGIIGVHLWGRAAPVDELQAIAAENGLKLMFDAAHAFGSSYRGQTIGRFGECEVFSFHATKSFNCMEGGAITTNNDELRSVRGNGAGQSGQLRQRRCRKQANPRGLPTSTRWHQRHFPTRLWAQRTQQPPLCRDGNRGKLPRFTRPNRRRVAGREHTRPQVFLARLPYDEAVSGPFPTCATNARAHPRCS